MIVLLAASGFAVLAAAADVPSRPDAGSGAPAASSGTISAPARATGTGRDAQAVEQTKDQARDQAAADKAAQERVYKAEELAIGAAKESIEASRQAVSDIKEEVEQQDHFLAYGGGALALLFSVLGFTTWRDARKAIGESNEELKLIRDQNQELRTQRGKLLKSFSKELMAQTDLMLAYAAKITEFSDLRRKVEQAVHALAQARHAGATPEQAAGLKAVVAKAVDAAWERLEEAQTLVQGIDGISADARSPETPAARAFSYIMAERAYLLYYQERYVDALQSALRSARINPAARYDRWFNVASIQGKLNELYPLDRSHQGGAVKAIREALTIAQAHDEKKRGELREAMESFSREMQPGGDLHSLRDLVQQELAPYQGRSSS